jgi:hypothetical protein
MAKGCGCSFRGGFYPSVMHGIATTGPYFMTTAVAQGFRLIQNDKERMKSRRSRKSRRKTRRR